MSEDTIESVEEKSVKATFNSTNSMAKAWVSKIAKQRSQKYDNETFLASKLTFGGPNYHLWSIFELIIGFTFPN